MKGEGETINEGPRFFRWTFFFSRVYQKQKSVKFVETHIFLFFFSSDVFRLKKYDVFSQKMEEGDEL